MKLLENFFWFCFTLSGTLLILIILTKNFSTILKILLALVIIIIGLLKLSHEISTKKMKKFSDKASYIEERLNELSEKINEMDESVIKVDTQKGAQTDAEKEDFLGNLVEKIAGNKKK